MHVYIIEQNAFFIEVEALKLFNFLQEDIFHQQNLNANQLVTHATRTSCNH